MLRFYPRRPRARPTLLSGRGQGLAVLLLALAALFALVLHAKGAG